MLKYQRSLHLSERSKWCPGRFTLSQHLYGALARRDTGRARPRGIGAKAPGIYPCPLRGSRPERRPAARPPPGGHSPANPSGRSVRRYSTQDDAR
eukprot:503935-Prymnesium_polylepis.1